MLSMVNIDCFGACVKIHGGLSLFLEGVGAGMLKAAEWSVERNSGSGFVDLLAE